MSRDTYRVDVLVPFLIEPYAAAATIIFNGHEHAVRGVLFRGLNWEREPKMTDSTVVGRPSARFWPQGWWKLVEFRIGIVPLPVYVLLAALVTFFILSDEKLASDLPTMIIVLALGGFGCAEIGKRLPVIRNIGAAAIFATFVPSYLVYAHLLPRGW